ncbi:tRNA threonylcarbamoyladenosine biosynthesis protein TsaB [Alphaproteobacteria bacterium]
MKILAFDTACGTCSVVILEDSVVLRYLQESRLHMQAERLMLMIEEVMMGHDYNTVTHIAITVGPGSFTGIRIGLACAHGIALSTNIKIFALTTLDSVAYQAQNTLNGPQHRFLVALSAGRQQYYTQYFFTIHGEIPITDSEITLMEHGALEEICNDIPIYGNFDYIALQKKEHIMPEAISTARFAHWQLRQNQQSKLAPLPLYIREHDAVIPKIFTNNTKKSPLL